MCVPIVLAVALFVFFFVKGTISPRAFAFGCAGVMVVGIITLSILLKHPLTLAEASAAIPQPRAQMSKRRKRVVVVLVLVWLGFALWLTRGGPWAPRLVGASVVLLYLIGTLAHKTKQPE